MIAQVLRFIPAWLWLLLAGALAGWLGWQHLQAVTAERDAAQAALETTRGKVVVLESALRWRREQARQLGETLAARDQALTLAHDEIQASRDALAQLEREDAETRDWAAQPVPAAVVDWVRGLADPDGDRASAGDSDSSAASDDATAGPGRAGDQQP